GERVRTVAPRVMILFSLLLMASAYLTGLVRISRRGRAWRTSRSVSFFTGMGVLFVALLSFDGYADTSYTGHMLQHLLLVLIAPPPLLLGRPLTLAVAASGPRFRSVLKGVSRSRVVRILGSPTVGFGSFAIVMWATHLTPNYGISLRNDVVHAC